MLNADDPLVADLGRETDGVMYFGVEDDARRAARAPARVGLQALPPLRRAYVYDAVYLGHLGRYHCPNCGDAPARARGRRARDVRAATGSAPPRSRSHRRRASARVELPLPGLYNVYNALGAAALCLALGVGAATTSSPAWARSRPPSAAPRRSTLGGRATSILLVKNPAGANEVLRTLALEGGELDVFGVLNDSIADGRDVSWVWDADWELLAAARARAMTCSGTRAAELALRLKYAGVDADAASSSSPTSSAGSTARSPTAPGPLYALPTYTALLELRELLAAARRGPRATWAAPS